MKQLGTRLQIDLSALEHNYRFLRSQLQPSTLFMAVVKANAYGHGSVPVAQKLQDLGSNYFAVAYVSEAAELRDAGITTPILVLHPQKHQLQTCIDRCVEPLIYNKELLVDFIAFAKAKSQTNYPIHIEFNCGLNRTGIDALDYEQIIHLLKDQSYVAVKGVSSHLGASEDLSDELQSYTQSQIKEFNEITQRLEHDLGQPFIIHQSNTSGVLNYAQKAQHHMVRSGIGLYGYGNDPQHDSRLKPVASLLTHISQIRTIAAGASVSYNRSYVATRTTTYAVLPLGHGDGINRIYGYGKAQVVINGQLAPTLGIVCMDMFMVDITHIENVAVGDEVVIFNEAHTASYFAESAGTISYELLTGIQKRVPRLYINY
jgi:alanine racemase